MNPKKKVRSNQIQIRILVDYMSTHKSFANGEYTSPMGSQLYLKQWEGLRVMLKEHGPDKTIEQWRHTWMDLKKKAREEGARLKKARATTGNLIHAPSLSELNDKILGIIGPEMAFGINNSQETGIGSFLMQPQPIQVSTSSSVQRSTPNTVQQQPRVQTESVHNYFLDEHENLIEWSEMVVPQPQQDTPIGMPLEVELAAVTPIQALRQRPPPLQEERPPPLQEEPVPIQAPRLPRNTSHQRRSTRLREWSGDFLASEHATTNVLKDILNTLKAQNLILQERNKSIYIRNQITNRKRLCQLRKK